MERETEWERRLKQYAQYTGGRKPGVKGAFELNRRIPHGYLEEKARAKLMRMGYRIVDRDQTPDWIKSVGSPDIIAEKDGEYILVEIKPSGQLRRYSKARVKLILVTDVETGRMMEVWGLREIEE